MDGRFRKARSVVIKSIVDSFGGVKLAVYSSSSSVRLYVLREEQAVAAYVEQRLWWWL